MTVRRSSTVYREQIERRSQGKTGDRKTEGRWGVGWGAERLEASGRRWRTRGHWGRLGGRRTISRETEDMESGGQRD